MFKLRQVFKFINHWLGSYHSKGFGIHSPFVFYLVTEIIRDFTPFYSFPTIEKQRETLLKNKKKIEVTDFGSGSKSTNSTKRKISFIAKTTLKPARQAQLLFRLINYFKSQQILEIGTSLGITTSYMASVSKKSKVITLEGCPEISKYAKQTFEKLNLKNIELITGNIDETLNRALNRLKNVDFIFFDGNHQLGATIKYFEQCLAYKNSGSIFVFDDIHSSSEMEQAWEKIMNNKEVIITIDLFHMGLVFFKDRLTRQHFNVRF